MTRTSAKKDPTYRHSFDYQKKTFAFYTGNKGRNPKSGRSYNKRVPSWESAKKFCETEGGRLAITKDWSQQKAVMKHIYEADAKRISWSDREYLLGGFKDYLEGGKNATTTGPWRWIDNNEEIKGDFYWASPDPYNYVLPSDPLSFETQKWFLLISTGSGFRERGVTILGDPPILENFACEYDKGKKSFTEPNDESPSLDSTPSCEFNKKKFTFNTNLLKESKGEFFDQAINFCKDKLKGQLAMTTTPEDQKAVMAFMKAEFGGKLQNPIFLLGGELMKPKKSNDTRKPANTPWIWHDEREIQANDQFLGLDFTKKEPYDGERVLAINLRGFTTKRKSEDLNFVCESEATEGGAAPCFSKHSTAPASLASHETAIRESTARVSVTSSPKPGKSESQSRKSTSASVSEYGRDRVGIFCALFVTIAMYFL